MKMHQVAIIGSGPAGYTAAIYAARAGLNPVLFKGSQPGGQLSITSDVGNYPGFPEGIQGPEMMLLFEEQAKRFGADVRDGMITAVDFSSSVHTLVADQTSSLQAQAVIISTGAAAKWLNIPGEQRLSGQGVSACAVCDGFFFKGQTVAVVGGGDSACEEASYLAKLCKKVYLLVRRGRMRASTIMQRRLEKLSNVEILFHHIPLEIQGKDRVEAIQVLQAEAKETHALTVDGVFVAIGHKPNSALFVGHLAMNEQGYIVTQNGSTKTNIPGVFAAGDIQDSIYRQAVTAAGSGCMGALDTEDYLAQL